MKFKEIERVIKKDGWKLKHVSGSHYQYEHPTKSGKVTIPFHRGDLHPKTIKSILEQGEINYGNNK